MTRKHKTALIGASLLAAAACGLWTLDQGNDAEPQADRGEDARPEQATAELSAVEQHARAQAAKPIQAQPEQVQRRYYDAWIGGLERQRTLRNDIIGQLQGQLASLKDDPGQQARRQALEERIEENRKLQVAADQKLASYRKRAAQLPPAPLH